MWEDIENYEGVYNRPIEHRTTEDWCDWIKQDVWDLDDVVQLLAERDDLLRQLEEKDKDLRFAAEVIRKMECEKHSA